LFSFITGKIKTAIIVILSVGIPIIYIFGKMSGGSKVKQAVLKEEVEKAKKRADFYKNMVEYEQEYESDRARTPDDFIRKLREDGL
jgi:uncharacterized membrane-anchored protein YhcB (DUF1043 family)